jgi:hypothetical protein
VSADKIITPKEDWQITCHEAGHAVICVRRSILFDYALRGEGDQGIVVLTQGWIKDPREVYSPGQIESLLLYYAGGPAAEEVLFNVHRGAAANHDRSMHAQLEKHRRSKRENGWQQDIQAAIKILDCESVLKVARALHRKKKLINVEVYRILGCDPPWLPRSERRPGEAGADGIQKGSS